MHLRRGDAFVRDTTMTPRKDIASSLVLILFSLTFLIYTTRYPLDDWESPGPAVFPLLLGAVLLLLAVLATDPRLSGAQGARPGEREGADDQQP